MMSSLFHYSPCDFAPIISMLSATWPFFLLSTSFIIKWMSLFLSLRSFFALKAFGERFCCTLFLTVSTESYLSMCFDLCTVLYRREKTKQIKNNILHFKVGNTLGWLCYVFFWLENSGRTQLVVTNVRIFVSSNSEFPKTHTKYVTCTTNMGLTFWHLGLQPNMLSSSRPVNIGK